MNEIKLIEVLMNGMKIGRIALTPNLLCAFEYSPEWIESGIFPANRQKMEIISGL